MTKRLTYALTATSVIASLVEKSGDEIKVLESVEFDASQVPGVLNDGENAQKSLVAYGLSKFLQDRTSASAVEDKLADMAETFELLKGGEWRQRKEGAGVKKAAIDPIFAQAIAELKGCTVAAATIALQAQEPEARKALRQVEAVKAKIAEIRSKAEGEAADLLADLTA